MSLSAPIVKQFRIAIFASTSLEDETLIPTLLGDNLIKVSHVYTNGANELVTKFAASHGLPFSVFPLTGGGSLPGSTAQILDNVDFAYVLVDPCSKSSSLIVGACEKKEIKHKVIKFDPVDYWKMKAYKAREILDAASKEDVAASPILTSLKGVL